MTSSSRNPESPIRHDGIPWLDWGSEPFRRAHAERKPVLLNIGAPWCHGCAVMESSTYADPSLAAALAAHTVPVRVDADRRPDINDRYNLEGLPTTVFLTPDGEMLAGSTYLTIDTLRQLLDEVVGAFAQQYDALMARGAAQAADRRRGAGTAPRYEPDRGAPDWVAGRLAAEFDPEHGGFGTSGKFLNVPALLFALEQGRRTNDQRLLSIAAESLDRMLRGHVLDEVEGGFFRYASGRDWSRPHTEKVLEDQAAMVRLLARAGVVFGRDDYLQQARRVMQYVTATLADRVAPAFFASQAADEGYYAVRESIRESLQPPRVDRTLFTDVNAHAASAWIEAGLALDDAEAVRFGAAALDRVLSATYRPGDGVAHFDDHGQRVTGLLTDQVHAAWAALDLHEVSGDETWWMLAEELLRYALRVLWDEQQGGFRDRAPGGPGEIGLLKDPLKPLALNCLAARALARLARVTGKEDLRLFASAALASQTPVYRGHGIGGAPYAMAIAEIFADETRPAGGG